MFKYMNLLLLATSSVYPLSLNKPPSSSFHPQARRLTKRACENSASDRSCWGDYDTSTDYYNEAPDTGNERVYYLELTNTTASPDGVERMALLVNGSLPGPTIEADWGDTVTVHVTNNLENNGSSIHFHGVRQNWTNQEDGVASITQCPIAPGETYTYTWRAEQYGSSWWHSHFQLQAWEGVFGPIVIHGPCTGNYDVDLGPLILNDWSHQTADELYQTAQLNGPPTMDNGLINGTNVYDNGGTRFETQFETGTSYLLRLVNGAIDTHFKFSIDNHTMTVVAMDFVPLEPFETEYISIGMGQRYDVVITANQDSDNYWMRAVPQTTCSENDSSDNIRGIVRYDSSSTSDPTSTGYDLPDDCDDMPMESLVPYLDRDAGSDDSAQTLDVAVSANTEGFFKWYIGGTTMAVEWDDPSLLQIYNNATTSTWSSSSGVIELTSAETWEFFVIETTNTVPHPIHLHGHDFYILSQDTGSYNSSIALQTSNPPRRDVAMLPSGGHLVIAFQTDNPGAWLMHCHIGWHTSEGFALQFIERQSEIPVDYTSLNSTCAAWTEYAAASGVEENDSGV